MLIQTYGLFWRAEEVNWRPGQGKRFELLGRMGVNSGTVRVCDFREQQGIYVLYDEVGPYYAGLTRQQGLGKRLKDHIDDWHSEQWQRFSWFGFRRTLERQNDLGLRDLGELAIQSLGSADDVIGQMEALLIQTLRPKGNTNRMKPQGADEWIQIAKDERKTYLDRI